MSNRPWNAEQIRLSLKIGNNIPGSEMTIGWWLFRIQNEGHRGEVAVPTEASIDADYIFTPAEFSTLRRDCGLSQAEAVEYFGVSQKTASFWENKLGAPTGNGQQRAHELAGLRQAINRAVDTTLELAKNKRSEMGVTDIDLYAYRQAEYSTSQPAIEGLPHGAHWRLLSLTNDALTSEGFNVTIKYTE